MAAPAEDLAPPGVDLEEYEIFLADQAVHKHHIKMRMLEAEREETKKKRRLAGIRKLEDAIFRARQTQDRTTQKIQQLQDQLGIEQCSGFRDNLLVEEQRERESLL